MDELQGRKLYVSNMMLFYTLKRVDMYQVAENKKAKPQKFARITNTGGRVLVASSGGTIGYIDAKTVITTVGLDK